MSNGGCGPTTVATCANSAGTAVCTCLAPYAKEGNRCYLYRPGTYTVASTSYSMHSCVGTTMGLPSLTFSNLSFTINQPLGSGSFGSSTFKWNNCANFTISGGPVPYDLLFSPEVPVDCPFNDSLGRAYRLTSGWARVDATGFRGGGNVTFTGYSCKYSWEGRF